MMIGYNELQIPKRSNIIQFSAIIHVPNYAKRTPTEMFYTCLNSITFQEYGAPGDIAIISLSLKCRIRYL